MSDRALTAHGIDAGYGSRAVLHDVDLVVRPAEITTIIGPNGCGKSTLLRVLAHLHPASGGQVLLGDDDTATLRRRDLARRLSVLPQSPIAPEGLTVADLVARGRQPHQPWYRQWSAEDDAIIDAAMADTGVIELADRALDELSGGQRQRAWIAMSLAQQCDVLLLDEPTTHLDLAHGVEVLDLVARLRRDTGRTVVTVLHDMNLAARYSDHLVVMKDGRVRAQGHPAEVMTAQMLLDVFDLRARVLTDPEDGLPVVVPVGHV